jgi:hypothetical protein
VTQQLSKRGVGSTKQNKMFLSKNFKKWNLSLLYICCETRIRERKRGLCALLWCACVWKIIAVLYQNTLGGGGLWWVYPLVVFRQTTRTWDWKLCTNKRAARPSWEPILGTSAYMQSTLKACFARRHDQREKGSDTASVTRLGELSNGAIVY